jgi:putative CRISPR-associated protein (TIGR02619 family)
MYSIISTVGTSVFGRPGTRLHTSVQEFDGSAYGNLSSIANSQKFEGFELFQQALDSLKALGDNFLRSASAEINGIEGILEGELVRKGHHFYFLASKSPAGVLAARVLAEFCKERYEANKSEVRIIADLQVADAEAFRRSGIPNLIQTVYELIVESKRDGLNSILNITGGFKASIPYLTIVGMLRDTPVSLIHETGNKRINLAGLPFTLDYQRIRQYKKLIFKVQEEQTNGVSLSYLKAELGLTSSDDLSSHPLWSLFESLGDNTYTLSGLGKIAVEELTSEKDDKPVRLSLQACRSLAEKDKGSTTFKNWVDLLNNIGNKVWRDGHRHEYIGCEYPACKMSRTPDRAFYDDRPDYVFILELTTEKPNGDYDSVPRDINKYDPLFVWDGLVES